LLIHFLYITTFQHFRIIIHLFISLSILVFTASEGLTTADNNTNYTTTQHFKTGAIRKEQDMHFKKRAVRNHILQEQSTSSNQYK
jgi:hypothetical protein